MICLVASVRGELFLESQKDTLSYVLEGVAQLTPPPLRVPEGEAMRVCQRPAVVGTEVAPVIVIIDLHVLSSTTSTLKFSPPMLPLPTYCLTSSARTEYGVRSTHFHSQIPPHHSVSHWP